MISTTKILRTLLVVGFLGLTGTATVAHAQGLGVKGGYSYGSVSNSGALPGNNVKRSGFALGAGISGGGIVGVGLEALYAQRGVTSPIVGSSRALDYLDIPVYLKVSVPSPMIAPFIYAGPQVSRELHCDAGGGGRCVDSGRPMWTYAGVIGAGLRLGGAVSAEARYIYGLSDLRLNTVTSSDSYRTRSFLVLLGLGF